MSSSVSVLFECFCQDTLPGDTVYAVGNTAELGNWEPHKGIPLGTTPEDFPAWRSPLCHLSVGHTPIEFKFVIANGHSMARWESTENRKINLHRIKALQDHHGPHQLFVCTSFESRDLTVSIDTGTQPTNACTGRAGSKTVEDGDLQDVAREHGVEVDDVRQDVGAQDLSTVTTPDRFHTDANSDFTEDRFSPAARIVAGNTNAKSYLQKLQLVDRLLLENEANEGIGVEHLAAACVYLAFIRNGNIPCTESGSHFRPNHHAAVARRLFSALAALFNAQMVAAGSQQSSPDSQCMINILVRRVMPLLLSFAPHFTCATPLTRIRDIAHRNDIPQDLKSRLKHTLQNKLHRCAGPEDLVTAERLLEEIEHAPAGRYCSGFVSEYRLFCEELREFFNARGLDDLLATISGHVDESTERLAHEFLKVKHAAHDSNDSTTVREALHLATRLREKLMVHRGLSTNQTVWLLDIALEEYVFATISYAPLLSNDSKMDVEDVQNPMQQRLRLLIIGLEHICLNGFLPTEGTVLARSLKWFLSLLEDHGSSNGFRLHSQPYFKKEEEALIYLRGILDRTRRYTESYVDIVSRIFMQAADSVGRPLNVPKHAIAVYSEADVRSSMAFQVSRLVSDLLEAIYLNLGTTRGVDVVVAPAPGERLIGVLTHVTTLSTIHRAFVDYPASNRPVIVLVDTVSGDEDVGTLCSSYGIRGIIVMHEVPHLSHLSIRARDAHLPLITVLGPSTSFAEQARRYVKRLVEVHCDIDVRLTTVDAAALQDSVNQDTATGDVNAVTLPAEYEADLQPTIEYNATRDDLLVYDNVKDIVPSRCGSKAASCAVLMKLLETVSQCEAPRVWCFPFGTMESLIAERGHQDYFEQLLSQMDAFPASSPEEALIPVIEAMDHLIHQLVPTKQQLKNFSHSLQLYAESTKRQACRIPLIVRSSANVEDLHGLSNAGLYESISNVNPCTEPSAYLFGKAMTTVWASLYSKRAILSRKASRFAQASAHMSVVVQELVTPYLSFVMHTRWPLSYVPYAVEHCARGLEEKFIPDNWIYVELALGHGEILASGCVRGTPHRLVIHKTTDVYQVLAFSTYSVRYTSPELLNGSLASYEETTTHEDLSPLTFLAEEIVDYTSDPFVSMPNVRDTIVCRLRDVGCLLEAHFQAPQDVEGGILLEKGCLTSPDDASIASNPSGATSGDETELPIRVRVVQSRPQPE